MTLTPVLRRPGLAVVTALALAGGAVAVAPAAAAAPPVSGPVLAQAAAEPSLSGRLNPVAPTRVMDTREAGGAVQAGADRELVVLGRGGVPETGVSAVVLNVTVTLGSERSDLQVYPVGQRPPQRTSNLNWLAGQTVPVQVQTAVGDGGRIAFSVHGGSAHVVVDVFGWYGDGSRAEAGSGFTAQAPQRLLDTRERGGAVQAGDPRMVQVVGNVGVPAGATAVMVNATMLSTPANADLQVFPAGQRPAQRTSNLNVSRGQTRANAVTTPIGDDGRIGLSVSQNTAHVVLDVLGYYSPDSTERFISTSPARILDTRRDPEGTRQEPTPVGAAADRRHLVANTGGVPLNASAAVLNVTATAASEPMDLQVYPVGDRPERRTSTLNLRSGMAVPNLAAATLGTGGEIGLSVSHGAAHVVLDVLGYFTSATWSQCVQPEQGWTAEYPGDWRTNAGNVMPQCSIFDPQPFALPEATEIPLDLAVQLRQEPFDVEQLREGETFEVLSEREERVDGRPAYRQERRQTETTTIGEGTDYTTWLVDLGDGQTLVASSYDVGQPAYDRKVDVLDEMMSRLDLRDDSPAFPDGTSPSTADPSSGARLTAADVRVGAHDGFDRTVFQLGGSGTPGWRVEYTDTVREQGSGHEVELEGEANLRVYIRGTVPPPATDEPYYDGPDRIIPSGTSNLQEVWMGFWFEGRYDAALGLRSEQPFRVFHLTEPNRLVVDVRHGTVAMSVEPG